MTRQWQQQQLLPVTLFSVAFTLAVAAAPGSNGGGGAGGLALPIEYKVFEEVPVNNVVGNLIIQGGLDKVYPNVTILRTLQFHFLSNVSLLMSPFDLEEKGVLKVARRLDREMLCPGAELCRLEYDVTVKPMAYFRILKVIIEVIDINDNAPQFPVYFHTLHIPESAIVDSAYPLPLATDKDSPQYGVRRYRLGLADHGQFALHFEKRGGEAQDVVRLILRAPLDYEVTTSYQLELFAYDGGNPERFGRMSIDITVVDSNDNSPTFESDSYERHVFESQPIGSVVERLTATDADSGANGKLTYSLDPKTQQQFGATFAVEADTGTVVLKSALDFENTTSYVLGIVAADGGVEVRTAHTYLIVNVQDVNDNAPVITVNALTESGLIEVWENSEFGTFVAHVTVVDVDTGDGGKVTCTINNDDFILISVFAKEYQLTAARQFDYESVVETELTLTCFDNGWPQRRSVERLKIAVLDRNDNAPKFSSNVYDTMIEERNDVGAFLLKVDVSDADVGANSDVTFSVEQSASKFISIDPKTGLVKAVCRFDYESQQSFRFTVKAEDGGDPAQTSTAIIQLTVIDIDDERPTFLQNEYAFSVAENLPVGTPVGAVRAVDADSAVYARFHYRFDPADELGNVFYVDAHTGEITTRRVLDREQVSVYHLNVFAVSASLPQASASVLVIVRVTDDNDNAPYFVFPASRNNTIRVPWTTAINDIVAQVRAEDADDGINRKLSFSFAQRSPAAARASGSSDLPFDLDSSGAIRVTGALTSYIGRDFDVDVVAQDAGVPQRMSKASLWLSVVNEASLVSSSRVSSAHMSIDHLLVSDNLTVMLVIVFVTIVLCILILVAMVIIIRRRRLLEAQQQQQEATDTQGDGRAAPPLSVAMPNGLLKTVAHHNGSNGNGYVHINSYTAYSTLPSNGSTPCRHLSPNHCNHGSLQRHMTTTATPLHVDEAWWLMAGVLRDDGDNFSRESDSGCGRSSETNRPTSL